MNSVNENQNKLDDTATTRKRVLDEFEPLTRGFCAALRSKEYYLFLKDIFNYMNKVQMEIDPGPRSETYFLDKNYGNESIGQNWLKIVALYEKNYAPIIYIPVQDEERVLQIQIPESKDIETLIKKREEHEYDLLKARLQALYPPPEGVDKNILKFAKYFRSRPANEVHEDFKLCSTSLELTCRRLAGLSTLKEAKLAKTDPKQALDAKEERVRQVKLLFTRATTNFHSSTSSAITEALLDLGTGRIPFYAGTGNFSLDGQLGGFHGAGLVCFLGGTSGFKTAVKSSLISNHVLNAFIEGKEPVHIWGYIGEDGIASYVQRVMTNVLNREPFLSESGLGPFKIGEFGLLYKSNLKFRGYVDELRETLMSNCSWVKSPTNPTEKLNFNIVSVLETFESKILAGYPKPKFIILDYLNLLYLPRSMGISNRAQEVAVLSHLLDEWSEQHGIPIITSVQASISGAVEARDLRFLHQEDIHESKSVMHSTRMMVSLLPFTEYEEDGTSTNWMGLKILKNRNGPKDVIFVSNLDKPTNITFTESKLFTEAEWAKHKENILEKRNAAFGLDLDTVVPKKFGKGRGGKGNSQHEQSATLTTETPEEMAVPIHGEI